MRIHTNKPNEVRQAIYDATRKLPGVYATTASHGSRSHAGAIELSMEGNGYAKNTGQYGAGYEIGATWDEWGVVFAAIFDADPDAVAGSVKRPVYAGGDDYRRKTQYRFDADGLPEDTHRRHAWELAGPLVQYCKKCSAGRYFG